MIIKRDNQQSLQDGSLGIYDVAELVDSLNYLSFPPSCDPIEDFGDTHQGVLEQMLKMQESVNQLHARGEFESVVRTQNEKYKEISMNVEGVEIGFRLINGQISSRCDVEKYRKQLFEMAATLNATLYDSVGTKVKKQKKGILSFLGL